MPTVLEPTSAHLDRAARALAGGDVVAFPTETVYGLGADVRRTDGIERIFALKGRPSDNPLIAHVTGIEMARTLSSAWPVPADALVRHFWPGPLTLVVPKSAEVPDVATGGRKTVAVRAPAHEVARALISRLGGAIVAPSANRSGHVSPTRAAHVATDFQDATDLLILDDGAARFGLESTVLDLTTDPPRVLRPGHVTAPEVEAVIGPVDASPVHEQAASPGTAQRHYAPRHPAVLVESDALAAALDAATVPCAVLAPEGVDVPAPHVGFSLPPDPDGYARGLYETLRGADDSGAARLFIVAPPRSASWIAVHDRLVRATSTT